MPIMLLRNDACMHENKDRNKCHVKNTTGNFATSCNHVTSSELVLSFHSGLQPVTLNKNLILPSH